MSNFRKFLKGETGLATFSKENIVEELSKRDRTKNPFPLEVFNDQVKPFINALAKHYDIPRSFIGLSLLSAYSTAIGTAYCVTSNRKDLVFLPVWGALTGISSSGKSIVINKCFQKLNEIQTEFDIQWEQKTQGLSVDKINAQKIDTVIYRDAHIPTLVKSVLPDNPKGVLKYSDELIEWINGMNQLSKKEGTDEQFWISSWNCTNYSGIRSGKQKFIVRRPFTNVIGGMQYRVLHKLFAKDRDTTGFVFRLLFALPEVDKIAEPDPKFEMPADFQAAHDNTIERLYKDLPIFDASDDTRKCVLLPEATTLYIHWTKAKIKAINQVEDLDERDIHSGIFGKVKEYAMRFAAILHLADRALDAKYHSDFYTKFKVEEYVDSKTMERALQLADYFYGSAVDVYEKVQVSMTAPADVLICATMMKMGKSFREIGEVYFNDPSDSVKKKMERKIKKWILEYPKVFGAVAR